MKSLIKSALCLTLSLSFLAALPNELFADECQPDGHIRVLLTLPDQLDMEILVPTQHFSRGFKPVEVDSCGTIRQKEVFLKDDRLAPEKARRDILSGEIKIARTDQSSIKDLLFGTHWSFSKAYEQVKTNVFSASGYSVDLYRAKSESRKINFVYNAKKQARNDLIATCRTVDQHKSLCNLSFVSDKKLWVILLDIPLEKQEEWPKLVRRYNDFVDSMVVGTYDQNELVADFTGPLRVMLLDRTEFQIEPLWIQTVLLDIPIEMLDVEERIRVVWGQRKKRITEIPLQLKLPSYLQTDGIESIDVNLTSKQPGEVRRTYRIDTDDIGKFGTGGIFRQTGKSLYGLEIFDQDADDRKNNQRPRAFYFQHESLVLLDVLILCPIGDINGICQVYLETNNDLYIEFQMPISGLSMWRDMTDFVRSEMMVLVAD